MSWHEILQKKKQKGEYIVVDIWLNSLHTGTETDIVTYGQSKLCRIFYHKKTFINLTFLVKNILECLISILAKSHHIKVSTRCNEISTKRKKTDSSMTSYHRKTSSVAQLEFIVYKETQSSSLNDILFVYILLYRRTLRQIVWLASSKIANKIICDLG